jgi:hypothetical protein
MLDNEERPENAGKALQRPLTEPADLFRLLGLFGASVAVFFVGFVNLVLQRWTEGIVFGVAALILQFGTMRIWRKLRDERIAKKEALAAESQNVELPMVEENAP